MNMSVGGTPAPRTQAGAAGEADRLAVCSYYCGSWLPAFETIAARRVAAVNIGRIRRRRPSESVVGAIGRRNDSGPSPSSP